MIDSRSILQSFFWCSTVTICISVGCGEAWSNESSESFFKQSEPFRKVHPNCNNGRSRVLVHGFYIIWQGTEAIMWGFTAVSRLFWGKISWGTKFVILLPSCGILNRYDRRLVLLNNCNNIGLIMDVQWMLNWNMRVVNFLRSPRVTWYDEWWFRMYSFLIFPAFQFLCPEVSSFLPSSFFIRKLCRCGDAPPKRENAHELIFFLPFPRYFYLARKAWNQLNEHLALGTHEKEYRSVSENFAERITPQALQM